MLIQNSINKYSMDELPFSELYIQSACIILFSNHLNKELN
jgi:hypothetical protein